MRMPKIPFFAPAPLVLTAGVLSTALLALSTSGTLSAFTAQITDSDNSVTTKTLVMKQTGPKADGTAGTNVCTSSATSTAACTTINAFGAGAYVPGTTYEYNVIVESTGSAYPTGFTLKAGGCTKAAEPTTSTTSGGGDLCAALKVKITNGTTSTGTTIYDGTAAGLTSTASFTNFPAAPTSSASSATFHFLVTLPSDATSDVQGQKATVPLTWAYTL